MHSTAGQNEKIDVYKATYRSIKPLIDERLGEFAALWNAAPWSAGNDRLLFREMCFCTMTPQSNAHKCDRAATMIHQNGFPESRTELALILRECGVRFHNNKAAYILQNKKIFFPDTKAKLKKILGGDDPQIALQKHVAGWGLKEAAHFMRNTGFGGGVCILDRHILRQLALSGVIPDPPSSLTPKIYAEISRSMKQFAAQIEIPLDALDFVFWYEETGEIFK
jgi:N-glycosylase/DNA lyase